MNILMVNKFLYPRGGAETYVLKLGEYLTSRGHNVQYFGMDHPDRTVGNTVGAYTENMDFHGGSMLSKLTYPAKIVYSRDARRKIRRVLENFQPDVCHLNNFNYQLTPSIILEIRKWEAESGHSCKILYTAHDPQLVCPNHMCMNPVSREICTRCLTGSFWNCARGKCIHGSLVRSVIGSAEATLWNMLDVYRQVDTIICCSHFMKTLLDTNPVLAAKTVALHNFVEPVERKTTQKQDYVLYFGRFSQEKGIGTLVEAARELPHVRFVFAGTGPLEDTLVGVSNIENVGFRKGGELERLIRQARFSVIPSECNENCPFSVLESQMYGTPVLGANIAGIPELIRSGETGELFESRNKEDLKQKIELLWNDPERLARYAENCVRVKFDTIGEYTEKLMAYYQ